MADINAKVDVTRNGRGQIISYGVENTNTYSPILLSDRNRQLLKKYNRSSFLDNVDAEFSEFTEIEGLLDLGLAAETSTQGRIYIEIPREVDLEYVADLAELITEEVGSGNVLTPPSGQSGTTTTTTPFGTSTTSGGGTANSTGEGNSGILGAVGGALGGIF